MEWVSEEEEMSAERIFVEHSEKDEHEIGAWGKVPRVLCVLFHEAQVPRTRRSRSWT